MSLKDDLIAARALIDTPEKWGKGAGTYLRHSGPACAHEALRRASPTGHDQLRRYLKLALPNGCAHASVPDFNDADTTTHAGIMALFQRAIDAAEKSEAANA